MFKVGGGGGGLVEVFLIRRRSNYCCSAHVWNRREGMHGALLGEEHVRGGGGRSVMLVVVRRRLVEFNAFSEQLLSLVGVLQLSSELLGGSCRH